MPSNRVSQRIYTTASGEGHTYQNKLPDDQSRRYEKLEKVCFPNLAIPVVVTKRYPPQIKIRNVQTWYHFRLVPPKIRVFPLVIGGPVVRRYILFFGGAVGMISAVSQYA